MKKDHPSARKTKTGIQPGQWNAHAKKDYAGHIAGGGPDR